MTTAHSSHHTAEPAAVPAGPALTLRDATRAYGGRRVVGPVTLEIDPGAVCLIEGANGTGKTTLLRVAAGLLAPTTGKRLAWDPALYLRPGAGMRAEQTVAQALRWAERMTPDRGMPALETLTTVGLDLGPNTPVRSLSSGMRARLTVAVALVAGPSVACLDEPAAHLDAAGSAAIAVALDTLAARGAALLLATPEPDDLAGLADTRIRLRDGHAEVRK